MRLLLVAVAADPLVDRAQQRQVRTIVIPTASAVSASVTTRILTKSSAEPL